MDISAIVLFKLLEEQSLDGWAKLKHAYLDPSYSGLYTAINKHYNQYNRIPSFSDLEVTTRDTTLSRTLATLKELEAPDVSLEIAIDALIDNYTQTQSLLLLDKFVDNIYFLNCQEVKDSISGIAMKLDEITHASETVVTMDSISFFQSADAKSNIMVPLGLNNTFDSSIGLYVEELLLLGGKRGAGKSIGCMNACVNQFEAGFTSAYFTIEMNARETFERQMAMQAGVSHTKIRQNNLDEADNLRIVKARADMFEDADDLVEEYCHDKDAFRFESRLSKEKKLKENQIIIIDDRELTLTAIDLHLQKLKAQFGSKFRLAVIDYLNQIVVPGHENNIYDWTVQIFVSKKLKEFARKYGIAIFSPYQIDEEGKTRFARGILDAADIALLMDANTKDDGVMSFETTKIRGGAPLKFHSPIDWDTLRVSPSDASAPSKKLKSSKEDTPPPQPQANTGDIPW